jgi:hypothetical protein
MARCFDVPVLPSIVAAQLSIILFGPLAYIFVFYQVFWINPGIAVVYAPQLVALGILGRLEPARIRDFIFASGGIFALLLYSLGCDPLWAMISGIGLLGAFAVVALGPLRIRPVLIRCAALGCCLVLLLISGAIEYVYTLTQYSARVWFSDELAYVPQAFLASIMFISPKTAGSYYGICALGWLLGILLASGRVRLLAITGFISFAILVGYSATFLLMRKWWLPLPLYVEHSLFPLFTIATIAGYWAALCATKLPVYLALRKVAGKILLVLTMEPSSAAPLSSPSAPGIYPTQRLGLISGLTALLVAASVPVAATIYAGRASLTAPDFDVPFPDEPELVGYLGEAIGLRVGGEFRGSIWFVEPDDATMYNLWIQGIPTVDEYSQLVTPQAMYFDAALFEYDIFLGLLNHFSPLIRGTGSSDAQFRTTEALGVRYVVDYVQFDEADQRDLPFVSLPRRPVGSAPKNWIIYELPNPNRGNYSPTEVVAAKSGAEIIAAIKAPQFDFTEQVVLSTAIEEPLVPARHMRLSLIRGGLHVSGMSEGTSLVVLPQQFSNCLRARDRRVRLVRANLLMTGVIFSGNIDTDITFDYSIFNPGCRRIDLAELKRLIERRRPTDERTFADWDRVVERFHGAGVALGLLAHEAPLVPEPGSAQTEELASSGPVITEESVLADLPQPTTPAFAFIGIQGLNAEVAPGDPVVAGQPIWRLVAIPTTGRHYLAAQFFGLNKNQVYRIAAWVKGPAGLEVEMQVSDELRPRDGTPANYGSAIFDPAARMVLSASGRLKGRGIEQGPDGWQKIWVDLLTSEGEFVLAFGFFSRKVGSSFKGDGRLGLTFGGIEVAAPN